MNGSKIIYGIISAIIKITVYILIVVCVYRGAMYAYNFGFSVFSARPMDKEPGRDVTVTVMDSTSAYEIGEELKDYGLVQDARVFWAREYLSEYHDKLKPGIYTLNTSMTVDDMMKKMAGDEETDEK